MTKAAVTIWNRKGSQADQQAMIGALVILVKRNDGRVTISKKEWLDNATGTGLRARFNNDGSITLWTYDVVEDIKKTAGLT